MRYYNKRRFKKKYAKRYGTNKRRLKLRNRGGRLL